MSWLYSDIYTYVCRTYFPVAALYCINHHVAFDTLDLFAPFIYPREFFSHPRDMLLTLEIMMFYLI